MNKLFAGSVVLILRMLYRCNICHQLVVNIGKYIASGMRSAGNQQLGNQEKLLEILL